MKYIFGLLALIIAGCSTETPTIVLPNPEEAINKAKENYASEGYSSITVVSNGDQYSGKTELPQEIIYCVMDKTDLKLYVHKVKSIDDSEVKRYVDAYNTEMMRIRAKELNCTK